MGERKIFKPFLTKIPRSIDRHRSGGGKKGGCLHQFDTTVSSLPTGYLVKVNRYCCMLLNGGERISTACDNKLSNDTMTKGNRFKK